MNLLKILTKVGGGIIKKVIPGAEEIFNVVNDLLPAGKKLKEDATGADMLDAISELPPEQQAAVMNKKFDVEITQIQESNDTLRTMLTADATMAHTTRPKIAYQSFQVVAFSIIVSISIRAYGVVTGNTEMVKAVDSGWPFILSVTGPLVTLLLAYFGVLRSEQKNKLDASNGVANPAGLIGMAKAIWGKKS